MLISKENEAPTVRSAKQLLENSPLTISRMLRQRPPLWVSLSLAKVLGILKVAWTTCSLFIFDKIFR